MQILCGLQVVFFLFNCQTPEEMTEIYYNSHQFDRTLAEILKRKVSPFDFFHELAVYSRL